jgi:hypothetical protein
MNKKPRAKSAALMLSILKISLLHGGKNNGREIKAGYAHCDTNAQDGFRRLSCLAQITKLTVLLSLSPSHEAD